MNLFTAAVYTNGYRKGSESARYTKLNEREKEICDGAPHILESWHYVGRQQYVDAMRRDGAKVFLDSGAFSAYTLGVTLSIPEYCDYIQRNMDIIRIEDGVAMASVLDGIGDALQTYRNQLEMEARGVRPLPCYHFGEDPQYLEYYVKNYEYITLGGLVGGSSTQLMKWLDEIWNKYLLDGSGRAKIKVHGFGITAIPIMERYDWYSVDSSSWIQSAAFGGIVTPKWGPLSVSDKSPARHDAGQHLCNLSAIEQAEVMRSIEEQGFNYDRLSTVYESRAAYNIYGYRTIGDNMNHERESINFKNLRQTLF